MTFPKGNTTERGYGNQHQRLRREWAPKVEHGDVPCARCRKLIPPDGYPCPRCGKISCRWDLGHDDRDRTITRGPEHSCCNRATAAHKVERRQQHRWRSRNW